VAAVLLFKTTNNPINGGHGREVLEERHVG